MYLCILTSTEPHCSAAAAARLPCEDRKKAGAEPLFFFQFPTAKHEDYHDKRTCTGQHHRYDSPRWRNAGSSAGEDYCTRRIYGKTATNAAAAAGISRSTLYNWTGKDFRFQAALNRGRRDLQRAVACRAGQLAADATECVARAVREGNVKAALEIVKRANVFAASKIGSDDEAVLQFEEEERHKPRSKAQLGPPLRTKQGRENKR